jgi:hypothetical protein
MDNLFFETHEWWVDVLRAYLDPTTRAICRMASKKHKQWDVYFILRNDVGRMIREGWPGSRLIYERLVAIGNWAVVKQFELYSSAIGWKIGLQYTTSLIPYTSLSLFPFGGKVPHWTLTSQVPGSDFGWGRSEASIAPSLICTFVMSTTADEMLLALSALEAAYTWRYEGESIKLFRDDWMAGNVPTAQILWNAGINGVETVSITSSGIPRTFEIVSFYREQPEPWKTINAAKKKGRTDVVRQRLFPLPPPRQKTKYKQKKR